MLEQDTEEYQMGLTLGALPVYIYLFVCLFKLTFVSWKILGDLEKLKFTSETKANAQELEKVK